MKIQIFFKWVDNYLFLDIMDEKIYSRKRLRLPKRIINKKNKLPKKKYTKKISKIIVILTIAISFAHFSINAIEPIIEKNCKTMAKSVATKVSNIKATEVMAKYEYNDILNIKTDELGNIKMVETNIYVVNKIISDVPVYIQEELEREENSSFKIPLGSFLGSNLFAGRGPNINVKMKIAGDLETDLKSEFIESGINQTLHKIYLDIKCKVIILTPFKTIEEQILNQLLLAEGVIVGEIPSTYYNLEGIQAEQTMDVFN